MGNQYSKKWLVNDSVYHANKYLHKLNYDLEYAEERVDLVDKIINEDYWLVDYISSQGFIDRQIKNKKSFLSENDPFCAILSKIVDYIDFAKYNSEEDKQEQQSNKLGITTKKLNLLIEKENIGIIEDLESNKVKKMPVGVKKKDFNYKLAPKQTINECDRKQFAEINELMTHIEYLENVLGMSKGIDRSARDEIQKQFIKKYGMQKLIKLKRLLSDLRKEILVMKDKLRGTIYFKKLGGDSTKYTFEEDTGYFDENGDYITVSENKLDFRNPRHILLLLEEYSALKEQCTEDPSSELWAIMQDFDDLLEKTPFEAYMRDILIMKIDKDTGEEICMHVNKKYGLELSERNISFIWNEQIPKLIASTYDDLYEEWLYTYKVKGKYKTCSKCGEVKLANHKYFSPDKRNSDGFHSFCRTCR